MTEPLPSVLGDLEYWVRTATRRNLALGLSPVRHLAVGTGVVDAAGGPEALTAWCEERRLTWSNADEALPGDNL